ncbi:hypothetical protein L596_028145 [Steinernema carpocapsae]|uniref:SXP/RAL-2 family protein Ani s 5-like cation-binding domain-containing protein n=1 Tax=Steinernema carpocapsae TaxID=34508 RepID=A0A4U5LXK8_STECR|nr:hypothetical protein L596_028145 [Steinernema carpocapsae]
MTLRLLSAILAFVPLGAAFVLGGSHIPNIGSSAQYRSANRRIHPGNSQMRMGAAPRAPYGVPVQGFSYFPMPVLPVGVPVGSGPCPPSPYAQFLTTSQQEALHELVTEARKTGANESTVRGHMDRYVRQILSPEAFSQFQQANVQFEAMRRGKRSLQNLVILKDDPYKKEQIHIRKPRKTARKVRVLKKKSNQFRKSW